MELPLYLRFFERAEGIMEISDTADKSYTPVLARK